MDNEHIEGNQKESEREEFKRDHPVREDDETTIEKMDMLKARLTIEKEGVILVDYSMGILDSLKKDAPGIIQADLEDLANKAYEMLIK